MENTKLNNSKTQHNTKPNGLDDSLLDSQLLNLPKEVLKRVNALKNIQVKMVDIESKFYDELHQLECKYASMYEPLLNNREHIVNGAYDPTDEVNYSYIYSLRQIFLKLVTSLSIFLPPFIHPSNFMSDQFESF
jgi:hypothetical protein